MRRAEHVRVGRVGLLRAHLVAEAGARQVLRHLLAAAELVDECRVEPRLVDAQIRIGEQPVAIEALDVVALVRAAVAPDVDVVLAHRDDEHRAGDGAADRRRVEVRESARRDVERARLQRGDAFGDERGAAVDEARRFRAVGQRASRNVVVVRLVRLAEIRGVGVGNRTLRAHPVQRGAGVETAGKGDADLLADGKILQDVRHETAASERCRRIGYSSRRPIRRGTAPVVRTPKCHVVPIYRSAVLQESNMLRVRPHGPNIVIGDFVRCSARARRRARRRRRRSCCAAAACPATSRSATARTREIGFPDPGLLPADASPGTSTRGRRDDHADARRARSNACGPLTVHGRRRPHGREREKRGSAAAASVADEAVLRRLARKRRLQGLRRDGMPELPDIAVYRDALASRDCRADPRAGPHRQSVRAAHRHSADRGSRRQARARRCAALGKRIVLALEDDLFLVFHLMIAGRLRWLERGRQAAEAHHACAARVRRRHARVHRSRHEAPRVAASRPRRSRACGDGPGRARSAGRGSRCVRGAADARKPHAEARADRSASLQRHRQRLLRRDPAPRAALAARAHAKALPTTMSRRLLRRHARRAGRMDRSACAREAGGAFPENVTAFRPEMAVHGKYGEPCPVCGAPVQRIVYAENECNYCARCQTGGKLPRRPLAVAPPEGELAAVDRRTRLELASWSTFDVQPCPHSTSFPK